jgi:hypothetical protein
MKQLFCDQQRIFVNNNGKKFLLQESTCILISFLLNQVHLLLTELLQHVRTSMNHFQDAQYHQMVGI